MKSPLNFKVTTSDGRTIDMHDLGIWVESFKLSSPNPVRNKVRVPGRPGALVSSTSEDVRFVNISLQLEEVSYRDLNDMKHRIYSLFYSKDELLITRDNQPNKQIKAIQEGYYDIDHIVPEAGIVDVQMTMIEPFLIGPSIEASFPTDAVTVENQGQVETPPVFNLTVKDSITYAVIQNQFQDYMMIGRPFDVEEEPFEREELILHDTLSSTVGWSTATNIDNGVVRGEMRSDGSGFYADTFGGVVETDRWQGPSLKRSFPSNASLINFKMDALLELDNRNRKTGMIEIYLLDNSENTVAKIGIEDRWSNRQEMFAKARAGTASTGEWLLAESSPSWNRFDGGIRISRHDNEWVVYIYQLDSYGRHIARKYEVIRGLENVSTNPVTQVQIAIRKYPNSAEAPMRVKDLKMYRFNQESDNEIPYIAHEGDIITFDHQNEDILINGEPRTDLKDFGATYFDLTSGENQLIVEPADTFDVSANFRERFR